MRKRHLPLWLAWCFLAVGAAAQPGLEECGDIRVARDRAMLGIRYFVDSGGLRVRAVIPDGPAERAGLKPGDLLTKINGGELSFANDIEALHWLDQVKASVPLRVHVQRQGVESVEELVGRAITCAEAKLLTAVIERAEREGVSSLCPSGVESPAQREADLATARDTAFLNRFPAEGAVIPAHRPSRSQQRRLSLQSRSTKPRCPAS